MKIMPKYTRRKFFIQVKFFALCLLMYTSDLAFISQEPVAAVKPSSPLPTPTSAPLPVPAPVNAPALKPVSAIKKGFLSSAKSSIYPESISAKIKPQTNGLKAPPILLPDSTRKKESGSIRGGLNLSMGDGMEGTGSLVEELTDAQIKQLTKTGNITKTKHIPPPVPVLPPATVLASVSVPGAPSISTPTLPSSGSTTPSPNPSAALPSPVAADSSASCNSSTTSPVDQDVHGPSLCSSQTPSNAPQYTLLERGKVSMGDFEALKGRNTSTRYTTSQSIPSDSIPFLFHSVQPNLCSFRTFSSSPFVLVHTIPSLLIHTNICISSSHSFCSAIT
jgi:hypothetical protein